MSKITDVAFKCWHLADESQLKTNRHSTKEEADIVAAKVIQDALDQAKLEGVQLGLARRKA